jgi:GDP-mannose 4,6-dehydratase
MKVLITGITGFVGSHMADYLLKNVPDVEIFGMRRWRSRFENVSHLYQLDNVTFLEGDLSDRSSISKILYEVKPDVVYHFAAQSFPESSFKTPTYTLNTNVIGTTNLLEELRLAQDRIKLSPVIVSVSSSEVYGNPEPDEVPIKETNPIRAANPYSISKVGHDLMSQYYYEAFGLKMIITRMFSHEGKRRGKIFALSSFAYQVVQNEKGFGDYTYWLAVDKCDYGEVYNIGGDYTCTVGDALDMLISKSTVKDKLKKVLDSDRVRPTDITLQIPDSTKFREKTGWKPTKGLEEICDDLLDYWRNIGDLY